MVSTDKICRLKAVKQSTKYIYLYEALNLCVFPIYPPVTIASTQPINLNKKW